MPKLTDKVAIITGAAQGIGLGIARVFVAEGANVIISDVNDAAGLVAERELAGGAAQVAYVHADVAREDDVRQWTIQLDIQRAGESVFAGQTSVDQIKRPFGELIDYLFRSQIFPHGAMLLTGAGIVPPEAFTLAEGDRVRITISGIGTLENPVTVV